MVIQSHEDFKVGYAIKNDDKLVYCATTQELAEQFTSLRNNNTIPYLASSVQSMLTPSKIHNLPKWLAPILVVKTRNVTYIGSEVL